jgi:hypothetical protein
VALAAVVAGCLDPPPAPPDLARRTVAPSPPPTVLPERAEVELSGAVEYPLGKGEPIIFVTLGECWKPGTRELGHVRANGKAFFVEYLVPQGTRMWICGAIVPPKGPITIYGSSPRSPVLGQGVGEVVYAQLDITMKKGPPVELPAKP